MSFIDVNRGGLRMRGMMFPLVLVVIGAVAYLNSFKGVFLFDDCTGIVGRHVGEGIAAWISRSTRPLAGATFYLNRLIAGGDRPADYHLVNLVIHLLAGLVLYGLAGRTLSLPKFNGRHEETGPFLAFAVAALWLVHPLQTESVTYISQRAESLMGLFYLLTLYLHVLGATSPSGGSRWLVASTAACAAGMLTKPVMVTAPLMAPIYDMLFIGKPTRRMWKHYAALAATWSILAFLLSARHESSNSSGFDAITATPFEYAASQPGVILHYVRLAFWPRPLCLDYAWEPLASMRDAAIPAAIVIAFVALSAWAASKRNAAGFCGLWFFIILAPSSSFVPITDLAAEHRMYLPLAGMVALAAGSVLRLVERLANVTRRPETAGWYLLAVLAPTIVALVLATAARNRSYYSTEVMWRDVIVNRPGNCRAHVNLVGALLDKRNFGEAEAVCRDALKILPDFSAVRREVIPETGGDYRTLRLYVDARYYAHLRNCMGAAKAQQGMYDEAIAEFKEALRLFPQFAAAEGNLREAEREKLNAGQGTAP